MFSKLMSKLKKTETVTPQRVYGPVEYIICGLGNPGPKYGGTRHNIGFCGADYIAQKLGVSQWRAKYKASTADAMLDGHRVLLLKPATFMNLSGQAVQEALANLKLDTARLIVIYDDVALPVGKMRIRRSGSDGGHNGIKNIIYLTGRDDFPRIKLGIGPKPRPDYDLADWVLGKFTETEGKALAELLPNVYESCRLIIEGKTDEAMNKYN